MKTQYKRLYRVISIYLLTFIPYFSVHALAGEIELYQENKLSVAEIVQNLKANGFTIQESKDVDTEVIVVYVYDDHTLPHRQKTVAPLFELLFTKLGSDAIGLESHWTSPLDIKREKDSMETYFQTLKSFIDSKAPYLSAKSFAEKNGHPNGVVKDDIEAPIRKYFNQYPTFGIEDKTLWETSAGWMHYLMTYSRIMQGAQGGLINTIYEQPNGMQHFSQYTEIIDQIAPGIPMPIKDINDIYNIAQFREDALTFNLAYQKLRQVDRSNAFANNIRQKIQTSDIKQPVILVGNGHLIKGDTNKLPEGIVHIPVQQQVKSSYIIVKGSSTKQR
ncbi:MAG: hypothetical protein R3A45_03675 [Bdellovibrionota bacterium]